MSLGSPSSKSTSMTGSLLSAVSANAPVGLTFEAIYETEFDYVYRILARLVGATEAEDLVQEVFLVVHRRLPEYRREARLTTWLFRIAYRVAGAHVRRERFRRRLLSMFGIEARTIENPAQAAHDGAEAEQVRAALAQLSFAKSSVLVLYEVEGWSCQEIADLLAVPLGTVHTRLHHARRDFARACQHTIARSRT